LTTLREPIFNAGERGSVCGRLVADSDAGSRGGAYCPPVASISTGRVAYEPNSPDGPPSPTHGEGVGGWSSMDWRDTCVGQMVTLSIYDQPLSHGADAMGTAICRRTTPRLRRKREQPL
jgi:hypothetical protein